MVVDNCSNDDSINNLQQQCNQLNYLRIVKNKKNYGRIGNWNRCLEIAQGKFILFLFANDLIAKDNHMVQALNILKHQRSYPSEKSLTPNTEILNLIN